MTLLHFHLLYSYMRASELSWAAHLSLNMVMSAPIPRRGVFEFAQAYGSVVLKVMGPLTVLVHKFATVVPCARKVTILLSGLLASSPSLV